MVGIVIVSHSAKLAEAVKELAQQMIQTDVPWLEETKSKSLNPKGITPTIVMILVVEI